jgi:hypothetical protein
MEIQEIRQSIKERQKSNQQTLSIAQRHQEKLKFHSVTRTEREFSNIAANEFLNFVRSLLPEDKFTIFKTLFKEPIPTTLLTEEAFSELEKVFDGINSVRKYEFTKPDYEVIFSDYLKSSELENYFSTTGFEVMKSAINTMLVVDLPSEQTTEYPEPYICRVDIKNIKYFETEKGKFKYVVYNSNDKYYVICDQYYRTFKMSDSGELDMLVSENPHDLGYCPASWFWTDTMSIENNDLKKSPISGKTALLDWILFYSISKQFSDLYAPFSIYWGYEQDCNYTDGDVSCDHGFLLGGKNMEYLYEGNKLKKCPKCSSRITGAGSFIEVPVPTPNTPALSPPVGIVPVDVNSLNYNVGELVRLETKFKESVTGVINEQTKEAVNEKQVLGNYEKRKQVLYNLKTNFEHIEQWTFTTMAKLMFGENFVSYFCNYGTEFYLYSSDDLLKAYNEAKAMNADQMVLDELQEMYIDTKYKNNKDEKQEHKILKNLDPFRHLTITEVKSMYDSNQIDYFDYMLKVRFSTLIKRFERENISLRLFGAKMPFDKKINEIEKVLKSYIIKPIGNENKEA